MQRPDPKDQRQAAQTRRVAFVLAGTITLWMGAQWLGGQLGLDARYAFLLDLAAIAAFLWAMVVTYQIWRERRG